MSRKIHRRERGEGQADSHTSVRSSACNNPSLHVWLCSRPTRFILSTRASVATRNGTRRLTSSTGPHIEVRDKQRGLRITIVIEQSATSHRRTTSVLYELRATQTSTPRRNDLSEAAQSSLHIVQASFSSALAAWNFRNSSQRSWVLCRFDQTPHRIHRRFRAWPSLSGEASQLYGDLYARRRPLTPVFAPAIGRTTRRHLVA